MISLFTLFEGMLIGLFFFSALFSLFLALKYIDRKTNLAYFVFATFLGLGITFNLLGFYSNQVSEFLLIDKISTSLLAIAGISYIYLLSNLTKYVNRPLEIFAIICLSIFFIINIVLPNGAAWSHVEQMSPTQIFNVETIYYAEGTASRWLLFVLAILLLLLFYSSLAIRFLFRTGQKQKAVILFSMFTIGLSGLIVDQALIYFYNIQILLLDDLGYMGFIVLVGYINFYSVLKSAQMKKDLEQNEIKFRSLFQNAGDGILLIKDGKIIECNKKSLQIFDCKEDELIGKAPHEISPKYQSSGELSSELEEQKIKEALVGESLFFEWIHKRKDGSLFNAEITLDKFIINENHFLQARVKDVTHTKSMEIQLKESEFKLRTLIEGMNDGVMQVDNDDRIVFVNNKFTEILGYTLDEIKGKPGYEVLLDQADHHIIKKMNTLRTKKVASQYEIAFRSKSGKKIDFLVSGSPVYNSEGEVIGSFGVLTDITLRKSSEERIKLSEEKFRSFIEQSSNGFVLMDKNGIIIEFNAAQEKLTGIPKQQAIGKYIWDIQLSIIDTSEIPLLEAKEKLNRIKMLTSDPKRGRSFIEKIKQTEIKIINRNGNSLVILQSIFPIQTEKELYVGSIYIDITERKIAEEAVRNIIDSSPFGAHSYKINGNDDIIFSGYNKSAEQILGSDHSVFMNKTMEELFPHLTKTELVDVYKKLAKGELRNYEGIIRYDEKGVRGIFEIFAFNTGENKMSVFFIDTTEKRKAEDTIAIERKNFLRIFEDSPIPMQIIEKEVPHKRLIVNKAYSDLVGVSIQEIYSSSIIDDVKNENLPVELYGELSHMLEYNGELENHPFNFYHKKLGKRNLLLTLRSIIFNDKECILNVVQDITEIEKARKELQSAFNYIQFIMDSIQSVIISVDVELFVTHSNKASREYFDEEAEDEYLFNMFPGLNFIEDSLREAIRNQSESDSTTKSIIKENGEIKNFLLTVSKIKNEQQPGFVLMIEDVTERQKIDELMIQSEKMLSVAGLAAGMAHEINNPLGTIVQGCQNILRRTSDVLPKNNDIAQGLGLTITAIEAYMKERQIHDIIESMRTAAAKASEIIKNMLQFSRRSESKKVKYDMIKLVNDTLELAYNDYDMKKKFDFRNIDIIKEFPESLPDIKITVTEIEQVIFNIVRNAAQAIHEENNLEKIPQIIFRLKLEAEYVVLEIEDNGPGIPEKISHRIFEPFFTTKEVGDGTGLGLSVSYMIIKNNHDGILTFNSKVGRGTTFIIKLPR